METESYENVANTYETIRTVSYSPTVAKQDKNRSKNKKSLFVVVAILLGFSLLVSVTAFILILQLHSEVKHMHGEFSSFLGLRRELEIIIKNEISQLDSKIYNGENKLNTSLSDANAKFNEMLLISGWFRASNNLIYKRFTHSVNYATAKAQCEGMGARLVSTGTRNNKVINEIFPVHYLKGVRVWIGFDDISTEGIWVWSDGVNNSPSSLWDSLEPNGVRGENCVEIRLSNSKIVANDASCTNTYRFVCERKFK